MSNSRKRFLISLLTIIAVVGFAYAASAQVNTGIEFGSQTGLSNQDIRITIARVIRIILGFLGIIAVGLVMYAGFLWMTARGNEERIDGAKKILRNGVIGLAIILASFGIVSFILSQLLQATTTGTQNGNGGNQGGSGVSGLGNGIVKSVYPEPFQKEVPRNTSIIVTFRETMRANSLCSTVTADGHCAPGAKILPGSVRIFKTTVGNGAENVTDVTAVSNDNQTFVFKPAAPYLGSVSAPTDYTVNLTNEIKKANGDNAFGVTDFRWSFEVSTVLDLAAPKILSVGNGGIFPQPDNEKDTVAGSQQATAASGTITVSGAPAVYQAANAAISRLTPPGSPAAARVEGTNRCADGAVTISIIDSNGLKARVGYSQTGLQGSDLAIVNNRIDLAPCGLNVVFDSGFAAGHSWRVTTTAERQADTLTLGSKMYSFVSGNANANQIVVGASNQTTAANISAAVSSIHPEMTASVQQNIVTVRAKIAGQSGNSLELSTSNPVALALSTMSGGADQSSRYTVRGIEDQPKNTVLQINFDEAINPLTIAGTSSELSSTLRVVNADSKAKTNGQACDKDADCLSYKCTNNICAGSELAGKFVVSNQYKTAEFISDTKCGVNGCGENIYCLPESSNLKVEVTAAALQACSADTDCTVSPFNSCVQGVCRDQAAGRNYPFAPAINGLVDAADNSLDGNRNNDPQGQADIWNENISSRDNAGRGDNYRWSFWISDKLDLTPPKILSTTVVNNQGGTDKAKAIEILFSKLMLSSSLTTGSVTIDNGIKQITHKLINLWSLANSPIGYWVQKNDRDVDPVDGKNDRTAAILGHGLFSDSTAYTSQVGSGVKDIYQNCYKPSAGPACNANALQPSCCRDQSGNLVPTADLTPDGNCL